MHLANPTKVLSYFDLVNKNRNTAFFIFDIETNNLEVVNGAFEKLVGKSLKEIQSNLSSVINIIHVEDRDYIISALKETMQKTEIKNVEFRVVEDESDKWLCLTAIPHLNDQNHKVVIGNIQDITKSKNHTFNLNKYNSKKNATLNIISHDLAGPFNTIQQLADLIHSRIRKYEDPEIERMIHFIKETSKKGTDLIQDFIAQEFLESSEVDVIKRRLDLVEKVKIIEEDYKKSQDIIKKTFNFYYSSPQIFVNIDDMKFMQVLNNIYSNAIKFTKDDAVINTYLEEKENTVLISIQDNGVGIPKRLQATLFEKFTKSRRPGLKGEKTTGLGMSLSKLIVEWHNGKIWFTSEENQGTTFFVEIPKN